MSWHVDESVLPPAPEGWSNLIPFGDVALGADGVLGVSAYCQKMTGAENACHFLRSFDNGQSWQEPVVIGPENHNETAILHLGDGHWIAAARTLGDQHLDLFRSDDNGAIWRFDKVLTGPNQHPAHLLRLRDGRILLTYGDRNPSGCGIYVRLSDGEGKNWGEPLALCTYDLCDSGYPATVQNDDGSLCTAYYAAHAPHHHRYHMAVLIWDSAD